MQDDLSLRSRAEVSYRLIRDELTSWISKSRHDPADRQQPCRCWDQVEPVAVLGGMSRGGAIGDGGDNGCGDNRINYFHGCSFVGLEG